MNLEPAAALETKMKALYLFIFISLPARVEETMKFLCNKMNEGCQKANHNQIILESIYFAKTYFYINVQCFFRIGTYGFSCLIYI